MRVDEFVLKHVNFLSGRIKLAKVQSNLSDTIEESHTEISEAETEPNIIMKIVSSITNTSPVTEESHTEISETENESNIKIKTASSVTNTCPVCANGDEPTGAHKCYICNKAVHAIDGCSAPVSEEGYGQE